jgi:hypothetical protein
MPLKTLSGDATTFELAATTNLPYERNLDEKDGIRNPESIKCFDLIVIGNLLVALRVRKTSRHSGIASLLRSWLPKIRTRIR